MNLVAVSSCQVNADVQSEKTAVAGEVNFRISVHFLNFNTSKQKSMSEKILSSPV